MVLKIILLIFVVVGFWVLWDNVFFVFGIFDEVMFWIISIGVEGESLVFINLGDLMVVLVIGVGIVLVV